MDKRVVLQGIDKLNAMLEEAVDKGATDIHISVGTQPRCRLSGELQNLGRYSVVNSKEAQDMIFPMMDTLARSTLNTTGQYDMSYTLHGVARFRVNVFKQKGDMAAVFRALPKDVPDYTKLGLPISLFNLYKKRRGLILVVGVTGSGKTTTLASFLSIINQNLRKHIITLEDPIEYTHWHSRCVINQREIGSDCDSFANGLRAALREDPDVILVGEMRDLETTEIAMTSAETGHLVCSTLHTLSASETVNRIIDMYPERQQNQIRNQLASILEAIVAQQLLPKKGGGYVVAYEIMYKNKKVKQLIRNNDVDGMGEYLTTSEAISEGMCSMDMTIVNLFHRNLITRDTALDYAFDRKKMSMEI